MTVKTVYISIGNSDDKLSQAEWSRYCRLVNLTLRDAAAIVHGQWASEPMSAWQNACWCIEIPDNGIEANLKHLLSLAAEDYRQDSIAWAEAKTEFIRPTVSSRRPDVQGDPAHSDGGVRLDPTVGPGPEDLAELDRTNRAALNQTY